MTQKAKNILVSCILIGFVVYQWLTLGSVTGDYAYALGYTAGSCVLLLICVAIIFLVKPIDNKLITNTPSTTDAPTATDEPTVEATPIAEEVVELTEEEKAVKAEAIRKDKKFDTILIIVSVLVYAIMMLIVFLVVEQ
jgi:hypothetical protein